MPNCGPVTRSSAGGLKNVDKYVLDADGVPRRRSKKWFKANPGDHQVLAVAAGEPGPTAADFAVHPFELPERVLSCTVNGATMTGRRGREAQTAFPDGRGDVTQAITALQFSPYAEDRAAYVAYKSHNPHVRAALAPESLTDEDVADLVFLGSPLLAGPAGDHLDPATARQVYLGMFRADPGVAVAHGKRHLPDHDRVILVRDALRDAQPAPPAGNVLAALAPWKGGGPLDVSTMELVHELAGDDPAAALEHFGDHLDGEVFAACVSSVVEDLARTDPIDVANAGRLAALQRAQGRLEASPDRYAQVVAAAPVAAVVAHGRWYDAGDRVTDPGLLEVFEEHLGVDVSTGTYLRHAPHLGSDEKFLQCVDANPEAALTSPTARERLEGIITNWLLAHDAGASEDERWEAHRTYEATLKELVRRVPVESLVRHTPDLLRLRTSYGSNTPSLYEICTQHPAAAIEGASRLLGDVQINELVADGHADEVPASTVMAKVGHRLTRTNLSDLARRDPRAAVEHGAARLKKADPDEFARAVASDQVPPRISLHRAAALMDDDQFADRVAAASDADLFELLEVPGWTGALSPARLRALSLRMRNAARPGLHPAGA